MFEVQLPAREEAPGHVSAGAAAAVVLAAAASLLPAIPSLGLARSYARIPVLPLAVSKAADDPSVSPSVLDLRSVGARSDGLLVAADWGREGVIAFPGGGGRPVWLPPRGRFELQLGADDSLYVLDVSRERLHRFDAKGNLLRSVPWPCAGPPALAAVPEGGLLVSDGRRLLRLTAGLEPSPSGEEPPLPGIRGIAASPGRIHAATADGFLWTLTPDGRVLRKTRLVGRAGRLAAGPGGDVAMAEERAGRVWSFDRDGRLRGRFALPAPQQTAGLCFTPDGALAVAGGGRLLLVRAVIP